MMKKEEVEKELDWINECIENETMEDGHPADWSDGYKKALENVLGE